MDFRFAPDSKWWTDGCLTRPSGNFVADRQIESAFSTVPSKLCFTFLYIASRNFLTEGALCFVYLPPYEATTTPGVRKQPGLGQGVPTIEEWTFVLHETCVAQLYLSLVLEKKR